MQMTSPQENEFDARVRITNEDNKVTKNWPLSCVTFKIIENACDIKIFHLSVDAY